MSAPDRIWAWPEDGAEDGLIYACEKDELEFACEKYGLVPAGTFLASTPARENAVELVEVLHSIEELTSTAEGIGPEVCININAVVHNLLSKLDQ